MTFTIPKRSWCYLFFLWVLFLTGCTRTTAYEEESVSKQDIISQTTPIELYVLSKVKAGPYEPETGIYTGAYVQKDETIEGDILKYEALTGQKQTFKVFNYSSAEGISKQDILKCMAQRKVPYIKLLLSTDYDLTHLYQLIFDLRSAYSTPLFIELYPLTEKTYTPERYKETYQRAYEIIHKYLKDVVIVWSSDVTRIEDVSLYYPGDRYTDWAGINVYIPRYKGGQAYRELPIGALDYWYKTFQNKKPMLISGLAISHFSTVDSAYTIQDTVDTLTVFYQEVLTAYPRLKGILYMDVDMQTISSSGKEDYTLTGHQQLLSAMQQLSTPLLIHKQLEKNQDTLYCYQKYHIEAARIDDQLYIPQEYMPVCFEKVPLRKIKHIEDLSGEIYYDYTDIQAYCTTFYQ